MTEDDDILAFEFALGTAQDRNGIARRAAKDPAFAAQVQLWEARLSSLNGGYADVPPPDLLPRIETRVFGRPSRRRILLGLGGLVAASVAGLLVFLPDRGAPMTLRLSAPDQSLIVEATLHRDVLRMTQVAGPEVPVGQSYQAWIIRPGDAPVSAGVLQGNLETTASDLPDGTVLAISVEPQGGSPTGQPTGPVILSATVEI